MPSLTAQIVRRMLRATIKPSSVGDDVASELRRRIDGNPPPMVPVRGVGRRPLDDDELSAVAGEWVGVPAARRHVLYLHGGYYVGGKTGTYRNLAARLAAGLGADVLLVDYRRAPEHPYPAAVDDAAAAYGALLDRGADPGSVFVVGDSAGGGLALALLVRLRDEGVPLPSGAALFSPWIDLTCEAPSVDRNDESDDLLSAAALRAAAAAYAGDHDRHDPGVSPLFADLAGLPPMIVTVDESEALLDDAVRLAGRLEDAGVTVELMQTTGLFHVWPVTVPLLREARVTVDAVVAFLDRGSVPVTIEAVSEVRSRLRALGTRP